MNDIWRVRLATAAIVAAVVAGLRGMSGSSPVWLRDRAPSLNDCKTGSAGVFDTICASGVD